MNPPLRCIALIDDSPADNFLHSLVIKRTGLALHIEVFEEPELALEAFRDGTSEAELVLLDINMPGMNGWEFLDEYNRLPPDRKQAEIVVMLTTSPNPADRERAEQLGILKGFCEKPLTEEMCRRLVAEHFPDRG